MSPGMQRSNKGDYLLDYRLIRQRIFNYQQGLDHKWAHRVAYQQKMSPDLGWASQCLGTKFGHKMFHNIGWIPCQEEDLRNGIFPAILVNKRCHNHQQLYPSSVSHWALKKLKVWKQRLRNSDRWGLFN